MTATLFIQELVKYADRQSIEGLFSKKDIKYEIIIQDNGTFEIGSLEKKVQCPINNSTYGDKFKSFLVAASEWVFAYPVKDKGQQRATKRKDSYWDSTLNLNVLDPATNNTCKELIALHNFYDLYFVQNQTADINGAHIKQDDGKGVVVFSYQQSDNFIHEISHIKDHIRNNLDVIKNINIKDIFGSTDLCAKIHNKFSFSKNPGAQVSFNEKAFESNGLDQGENFPVSIKTMLKYTAAFNVLCKSDVNKIKLDKDKILVFWTNSSVYDDAAIADVLNGKFALNEIEDDDQFYFAIVKMAAAGYRPFLEKFEVNGLKEIYANCKSFGNHFSNKTLEQLLYSIKQVFVKPNKNQQNIEEPKYIKNLKENIYVSYLFNENLTKDNFKNLNTILVKCIKEDKSLIFKDIADLMVYFLEKGKTQNMEDLRNKNIGYLLGRFLAEADSAQYTHHSGNNNIKLSKNYLDKLVSHPASSYLELAKKLEIYAPHSDLSRETVKLIDDYISHSPVPSKLNDEQAFYLGVAFVHRRNQLIEEAIAAKALKNQTNKNEETKESEV